MRIALAALVGAVAVGLVAATLVHGALNAYKKPKFAELTGAAEAPEAGDPDGRGSATLILPSKGKVCFAILVTGIDRPVAAHIHKGRKGVAGPVVVSLTPPSSGSSGAASGCTTAPKAVTQDIFERPTDYYVNVHTGRYPNGALRGQLFLAK